MLINDERWPMLASALRVTRWHISLEVMIAPGVAKKHSLIYRRTYVSIVRLKFTNDDMIICTFCTFF